MKRTPLQRKTPMKRKQVPLAARIRPLCKEELHLSTAGAKPSTATKQYSQLIENMRAFPKKRSSLAPVSPKLAKANVAYAAAKKQWRAGRDGRCEVWLRGSNSKNSVPVAPEEAGPYVYRCQRRADPNPHHMAGRGPNLSRIETFLGVCRQCHDWIHAHTREARRLGYLTTK